MRVKSSKISVLSALVVWATLLTPIVASRWKPGPKETKYGRRDALPAPHEVRKMWARDTTYPTTIITPKFFVFSLFSYEAGAWYDNMPSLQAQKITVPGVSPIYPQAFCTKDGNFCQLTLGEGEINAASSVSALIYSGLFDLTKTYFMVAGIAGINPHVATTGAATFAEYAVQLDLQYEFDARQTPKNDSSGYFPQGSDYPDENKPIDYPGDIYGTEVFELNNNLRKRFVSLAKTNPLNDSKPAEKYRKTYGYAPANQPPQVVECATGTSNVYWSGSILGEAFTAYTKLLTNGSGVYCATQQEDNAVLEALLRGDLAGKVDFSRVAVMRTASDFDRAPPDETEVFHLLYAHQNGFEISIQNIFIAGHPIVMDVISKWKSVYEKGIKPTNYIGDLLNSLGEPNPNIGP